MLDAMRIEQFVACGEGRKMGIPAYLVDLDKEPVIFVGAGCPSAEDETLPVESVKGDNVFAAVRTHPLLDLF
jgi:hypothetical protein